MYADHVFKVIDLHTGGAPTRVVLSGIPPLPGRTVMEKMNRFAAEYDWIRQTLTLEPRGGKLTSAVVLVPPGDASAHVGAFFMEPHGYLPMCGSDTIATVTALLETGQLTTEPEIRLDTPAGLIRARPEVSDGKVRAVTFRSAPAYAHRLDAKVDVEGYGPVVLDIGYGGNFYAITSADQLGLDLRNDTTTDAVRAAQKIRAAVNAAIDVAHPTISEIRGVTHVQLCADAADGTSARVMVIVPPGLVDRSPCGTGTTAKVATLVAKGVLQPGQAFTHHSVTGATFTGRAVQATEVGPYPGHHVEITGQSFLIADATLYVDKRDPLARGFLLT